MKTTINIILLAFLAGCLQRMPYGYYQLARVIITLSFISLAYLSYKRKKYIVIPIYLTGAIIYNPIIKFAFARDFWQLINIRTIVIVLAIICYETYKAFNEKAEEKKRAQDELDAIREKQRRQESNQKFREQILSEKLKEDALNDVLSELDALKKPTEEGGINKDSI